MMMFEKIEILHFFSIIKIPFNNSLAMTL